MNDMYVAQGLEYDLGTQGASLEEVADQLSALIEAELQEGPLEDLPESPLKYPLMMTITVPEQEGGEAPDAEALASSSGAY